MVLNSPSNFIRAPILIQSVLTVWMILTCDPLGDLSISNSSGVGISPVCNNIIQLLLYMELKNKRCRVRFTHLYVNTFQEAWTTPNGHYAWQVSVLCVDPCKKNKVFHATHINGDVPFHSSTDNFTTKLKAWARLNMFCRVNGVLYVKYRCSICILLTFPLWPTRPSSSSSPTLISVLCLHFSNKQLPLKWSQELPQAFHRTCPSHISYITLVCKVISALISSNSFTIWRWPFLLATITALNPFCEKNKKFCNSDKMKCLFERFTRANLPF